MRKKELFREESLKKRASVDRLNDILAVENPKAWMVLCGLAILLIGACIWSTFGQFESKVTAAVVSDGNKVSAYVLEDSADKLSKGMVVDVEGTECKIVSIEENPVQAEEVLDEYGQHVAELKDNDWVCKVNLEGKLDAGAFPGSIVIERVSPISFVVN